MSLLSSTELIAMGRHIPTPFSIAVVDENGELELNIDSIIRIVPGKRLVALSHWQNRTVVVKLFFQSNHWKRKMLRDIAGINLLTRARIPTPDLLLQTTIADNKAGIVVIEYLQRGASLATLFAEARSQEGKTEILRLATKSVALCHRAGLWQKDIHLDNFMLSSGVVHILDGGSIKAKNAPLDVNICLKNFALFIAQFPVALDEEYPALIEHYRKTNPGHNDEDYAGFETRIINARKNRLTAFERKLIRSTTANHCGQDSSIFYVYDRSIHSDELERFIADPDSYIDSSRLLKDGNSSTVAVVEIDKCQYVLKRYNIKSFWHGLSRGFRSSRAHHSWRNAFILQMLGVSTARPYLCLEERTLWFFRRRAYFLCEFIQVNDLATAWEKKELEVSNKDEIIAMFRKLFRILFDYRISHGDMKATNFLLKGKQLYVVDLDAMVRNKSERRFLEKFGKDLKRFQKNWLGTTIEPEIEQLLQQAKKF